MKSIVTFLLVASAGLGLVSCKHSQPISKVANTGASAGSDCAWANQAKITSPETAKNEIAKEVLLITEATNKSGDPELSNRARLLLEARIKGIPAAQQLGACGCETNPAAEAKYIEGLGKASLTNNLNKIVIEGQRVNTAPEVIRGTAINLAQLAVRLGSNAQREEALTVMDSVQRALSVSESGVNDADKLKIREALALAAGLEIESATEVNQEEAKKVAAFTKKLFSATEPSLGPHFKGLSNQTVSDANKFLDQFSNQTNYERIAENVRSSSNLESVNPMLKSFMQPEKMQRLLEASRNSPRIAARSAAIEVKK